MSDAQVVTELVVDASGAVTEVAQAGAALDSYGDKAQAAADQATKVQQAIDQQTASFVKSPPTIASVQAAYDKLSATLDPHIKMQQKLQQATDTITAAQQRGIITQTQANAALEAATAKYSAATGLSAALADATGSVTRSMVAMAGGAGPVGVFLSALGPWGFAAAVGIGVATSAIEEMIGAANGMGAWAQKLQDASLAAGINAEQLQVLDLAAQNVGVSADDMTSKFERFVVNLGQLKDGAGQLYTQLERVNPALVAQLSTTTSAAAAWDLLAKAYANADTQQRALIAQAAFGRGGAQVGQVLLATNNAGGIANASAATNPDVFPQEQTQQWRDLNAEITAATTTAERNFASIFTTPVLQGELSFVTVFKDFSSEARNFGMSTALTNLLASIPTWASYMPFLGNALAMLKGIGTLSGSVGAILPSPTASNAPTPPPPVGAAPLAPPIANVPLPLSRPETTNAPSLGVQVADYKTYIATLGDAATANEKLNARLLDLQKTQDDANKMTDSSTKSNLLEAAARGQAMAVLDAETQQLSTRIAVLGAAAPATDLMTQEEQKLQKALMTGTQLTQAEIETQRNLAAERALGVTSIVAQTDSLNVEAHTVSMAAGPAAAYKAAQDLINQAHETGKPLTDAQTSAIQAYAVALGNAAQAAAQARIASDISFGSRTALLSDQDVQIAQQLRTLYGNDIPTALASAEAAAMRFNHSLAPQNPSNDNNEAVEGARQFRLDEAGIDREGEKSASVKTDKKEKDSEQHSGAEAA